MTESNPPAVPIDNLDRARFRCVFPVCGGVCCKNGRPSVEPAEDRRIAQNLAKFLPHLRPRARQVVERRGFTTRRRKAGKPMLAVVDGWCVFFHEGCVLHKVGAAEGDAFRYKPWPCAAFPLSKERDGTWTVRQWGHRGEAWELFCLDPDEDPTPARRSLAGERRFVDRLEGGAERWRFRRGPRS